MQTDITTTKKSNQEVKVIAVNTLNEYAEKYFNHEREYFSQFVGKDIFKMDGSLKAKYDHEKLSDEGTLPDGTHFHAHYWFKNSYGSFDIHIKICVNGGTYDVRPSTAFCQYEEMTLTLFKVDNDGLLQPSQTDISHLSKRYDVAILNKIAAKIQEAAKQYEAICDTMPYRFKDVYWIERLTR